MQGMKQKKGSSAPVSSPRGEISHEPTSFPRGRVPWGQQCDIYHMMAGNYHVPSRRPKSPAEALFYATHAFNDASRRTPSPQFALSDRRSSQHVRRRSLEPVFEGEIKTLDNQRHSMGHSAASPQPKPNRSNRRVSSHSRRSVQMRDRDEAILSAEVKTNVVVR